MPSRGLSGPRSRRTVRGTRVKLGSFDDEEDAARAVDAAVAKYKLSGRTLNFPGEVPLASVLAALPPAPPPAPPRRSGRAPAPRVIVDAPDERAPTQKRKRPRKREIGARVGKYTGHIEGAYQKANGKWANKDMFPGREFDDLDEYRAAKKQRAARREEYSAQNGLRGSRGGVRDIE